MLAVMRKYTIQYNISLSSRFDLIKIIPTESEANKLEIIKWRLVHYSEVVGSTDLIFGMQGALVCLVETLEFQNTQRSEASFSSPA